MNSSFWEFIEAKPLYYKKIDHKRVHKAYALLQPKIKQPLTIHIVGTNGKGSTGRIMASLLHFSGKRVGHFSSPHILKFNERIWIEGQDIVDSSLDLAHEKLHAILGKEMSNTLSYFEYTTLLALVAMESLEVIVLEAGLGGEFDATNVCSKILSVITPIGLDHQDFLGETIEEIATTKMNSIDKEFVLALQTHDEVYAVSEKIIKKKKAKCHDVKTFQETYPTEYEEAKVLTEKLAWSDYLFENTLLALYALKKANLTHTIGDLEKVKLFGRFHRILPNVIIDVGHNLLATKAIIKALKKEEKWILVYNALNDKDYVSILKAFRPYVTSVEIMELKTARALEKNLLEEALRTLNISYRDFDVINPKKHYLVFGSFYVIESFLNKNKLNREIH
ncbi:MAG: Dihydrofolate synthase (EC @ Folylpolyglutamate synthase (EC [uncultured Sulfurovum sp.]|uniref:Dihydrofolate synthase ) n=1 Tax=uncultured Sulfurovum sp. TaxID=269237 RepID=A0A6S6SUW1_9BACT|nr:MAG: Dihydrofolate synthase (EC @ Folylpolyglutamate synthase (EC [uncultured Sulfurovum sp.]